MIKTLDIKKTDLYLTNISSFSQIEKKMKPRKLLKQLYNCS